MQYLSQAPYLLPLILGAGWAAGFLNGLLGLGGMSIYMPTFICLLRPLYPESENLLPVVLANSFCVMLVVSIMSCAAHHKSRYVVSDKVPLISVGALSGALMGFELAHAGKLIADMDLLFGIYIVIVGLFSLAQPVEAKFLRLSGRHCYGIGFLSGMLGGLVGFNGNTVAIPLLRYCGLDLKSAVATGNFVGLAVSLALLCRLGVAIGFDRMDIFLCFTLAIGGLMGSPYGARIKVGLKPRWLNIAFCVACVSAGCIIMSLHLS